MSKSVSSFMALTSAAVVAVDAHVFIGEVAPPGSCIGIAVVERHDDGDLLFKEHLLGKLLGEVERATCAADVDDARGGGERHVGRLGVERCPAVAERAEHAAPVGVGTEHGGLHEARGDDVPGEHAGRRIISRARHRAGEELGRAFAVSGNGAAQVRSDRVERGGKRVEVCACRGDFGVARKAVGHDAQHVVRRRVAVDADHVEGVLNVGAHGLLKHLGRDRCVRGDEDEHRGHVRVNHPGALGDAADGDGFAADVDRDRAVLGHEVGRHDRGCAVFAAFVGKCVDKRLHAGGDRLDRERLANDACRGDDDVVCAEAGRFGEQHAHLAGDSLAVRGAGVGVAGVAEHCLRASVGDVGLGDGDGRALDGVERVDGGCGGGHVGDDEGEVLLRLVAAKAAVNARGPEALRSADVAIGEKGHGGVAVSHGVLLVVVRLESSVSTEWLEEAGLGKAEPSGGIGVRHEVQAFERGSGGAFAEVVVKRGEKDAADAVRFPAFRGHHAALLRAAGHLCPGGHSSTGNSAGDLYLSRKRKDCSGM